MSHVNATTFAIVLILFLIVTGAGFAAARWRRAETMMHLDEWGLGGRGFGTIVTWFLLGGDLYTAYTFIAVPALVFASGAIGFYAASYTIMVYPIVFIFLPPLWSVSRAHGYVTPSDFIRGRYGSRSLSLASAFTGILALMPYIALQLVGIQAVLTVMGIGASSANSLVRDLPLFIAFAVLAISTYVSGLRAPAMIYLPMYSLLLALIALFGYMAIADKTTAAEVGKSGNAQLAVPYLFQHMFPSWFTGIAFAGIIIGALVPAAIMSIAAANLFTRNVFTEFFKPDASPRLQTKVSRWVSLVVKVGALLFAVELPHTFAINLQLLGGIWVLQLAPMLLGGLLTRWFHRWALLTGWLAGMLFGTIAAYNVSSLTASHWAGSSDIEFGHSIYIGLSAVILNLVITVVLTLACKAARVPEGTDETLPYQYTADPKRAPAPVPAEVGLGSK